MKNEILKRTGLDWTVSQYPLTATRMDGDSIMELETPLLGQFRDDNHEFLGKSTSRYRVAQNHELLDILINYFGSNLKPEHVTGGQVRRGAVVYFKIKQPGLFQGTPAALDQHLLVRTSHDGSVPISLGIRQLVQICTNGMTAWTDAGRVRILHTASMEDKLANFHELYAHQLNFNEEMQDTYTTWMSTKATRDMALDFLGQLNGCDATLDREAFVKEYSPRKWNIVQTQMESIELEMGRQGNNLWGIFNGITHYTSHVLGAERKSAEARLESEFDHMGSAYKINNKALQIANSYTS